MKISPRELREAQIPSKAFGFNQDVVDALLERAADTIEGLIEENRQLFEALERLRNEGSSSPLSDPFADVQMQTVAEPAAPETVVVAPAASIDAGDLAAMSDKEDLINKTLLLAQRTADETLKTAKEQAAELVAAAQITADELVSKATVDAESVSGDAQAQAQKDLADAQEQAQNMVAAAQAQADELVSTAQSQADSIHQGERDKYVTLITQLNAERAQLVSDIEILQTFDHEHRTKLRTIVEQDLNTLVERPPIDVGAIPELPVVSDVPIGTAAATLESDTTAVADSEVVAHAEMPVSPASFDEMLETSSPQVAPATEDDASDDVAVGEGEIESDTGADSAPSTGFDVDDPFASFVDAPSVVEPAAANDGIADAQIVEPAGGQVESSGSTGTFDPGMQSKSTRHEKLDDDDFFASLREAVQDDAPLGPSDEDDSKGGKSKGLFKR